MILLKQSVELIAFAGCARLDFAQGLSIVDLEKVCIAVPLLSLVVAGSRTDFDGHIADPGRIHTEARNVGVVDRLEKMILEEAELVVQLVLQ